MSATPSIRLTRDSLLENDLDLVDIWPIIERKWRLEERKHISMDEEETLIKTDQLCEEWRVNHLGKANRSVAELKESQKLYVSWLLAVGVSIFANFLVNSLFAVPETPLNLFFIVVASIGLLFFIISYFAYWPLDLSFTTFWFYPNHLCSILYEVPTSEIQRLAQATDLDQRELEALLEDFSRIIALCFMRDVLSHGPTLQSICIDAERTSDAGILFRISVKSRCKWQMLLPHRLRNLEGDLDMAVCRLAIAMRKIGYHTIDTSIENWNRKGKGFLGEVLQLDFFLIEEKLRSEIQELPSILRVSSPKGSNQ